MTRTLPTVRGGGNANAAAVSVFKSDVRVLMQPTPVVRLISPSVQCPKKLAGEADELYVLTMADHFSDDEASEVVRKIEALLAALHLSSEEDQWSRQLGHRVYETVTEAYTESDGIARMRAVSAAAGVAHALIMVEAWAKRFDRDAPW
jgi:hypothetical protein